MKKKQNCPNIHWFGAPYVDAGCIDGFLWDLDSCGEGDERNILSSGGDVPCPFCNAESFIEYIKDDMYEPEEMDDDGKLLIDDAEITKRANDYVLRIKSKYLKDGN